MHTIKGESAGRRIGTVSGGLLIGSAVALAFIPLVAWLPAGLDSARAGSERYLNLGLFAIVASLAACVFSVMLLTAGAIRSVRWLPRWSSAWWVLVWAALAWVPVGLLLLLGRLGLHSVNVAIVLTYAALNWAFAVSAAALGLLLVWAARWIVRTCQTRP